MKRILGILALIPLPGMADPSFECSMVSTSQVETGACLEAQEAAVEVTIEAALEFAMISAGELDDATGRPAAVPALEAGQAAWAAYRDAHCDFVGATFGGGSGTGPAIRSCRIELGRARVSALLATLQ